MSIITPSTAYPTPDRLNIIRQLVAVSTIIEAQFSALREPADVNEESAREALRTAVDAVNAAIQYLR